MPPAGFEPAISRLRAVCIIRYATKAKVSLRRGIEQVRDGNHRSYPVSS